MPNPTLALDNIVLPSNSKQIKIIKDISTDRHSVTSQEDKVVNGTWKRKNGLMQRERPPGRESSEQEDKVQHLDKSK